MPIEPDLKDWTWVLERPCSECGFDASTTPASLVPELVRANARDWEEIFSGTDRLAEHWSDDSWSGLEYACHVRDVFRICGWRLQLMLEQDDPDFPNWDQDAGAVDERYNEQDPSTVLPALVEAANEFADAYAQVEGEQWNRTGTRSDGARFTVDTFARYVVHDPIHHVWDVREGLAQLAAAT